MKATNQSERPRVSAVATPVNDSHSLKTAITSSWAKISPCWPLKNIIAVNPISGFEDLFFEDALQQAQAYFRQKNLPEAMYDINRESIKWLQAFFDHGQSTIQMPNRHHGFLKSALKLIRFDDRIHQNDPQKIQWLQNLPHEAETIIAEAFFHLGVPVKKYQQFLTLLLTTLPGWAAYIQYRTSWADADDVANPYTITQHEYLAFRLILTCLLWPEAKTLISWYRSALEQTDIQEIYHQITAREKIYQNDLLGKISQLSQPRSPNRPTAQLVFCIDVRSEPFRRALETQGNYETYGFAGFFGLPVAIENAVTGESHASCPVLLKPTQTITEHPKCTHNSYQKGYLRFRMLKKLYQSVKYTFTTPFNLVEVMGIGNGVWMGLKSFLPIIATKIQSIIKKFIAPSYELIPDIQSIQLEQQVSYGASALKMIGLSENFAPIVVFCGHSSTTQNNAYATALNCGACGGHNGAPNARILATILNAKAVRRKLAEQGIIIPDDTLFVAAEHNTTTDEVEIFTTNLSARQTKQIIALKQDLQNSKVENSLWRVCQMDKKLPKKQANKATALRSQDWAQVRPEWGLAKNAAFIVAPRSLTKEINLEGRVFLHSYEWQKDKEGSYLATILTAPMIVAQWINSQYLFSTLDNVAFGSGSKVTKNITGKIGIMQGNASDLMHGLPLQSVYESDIKVYHVSMRLTVLVYAPKTYIDPIIKQHTILQKLFGNGWVHLICFDPKDQQKFSLQRDFSWVKLK